MPVVAQQRCFNHASREAAALCPSCKRFFCRECIAEHDDRVLCTACLKAQKALAPVKRQSFGRLKRVIQFVAGILIAWFFFFLFGQVLVQLPDSFHEGTIWQVPWLERR
jgi:hypothetical protein